MIEIIPPQPRIAFFGNHDVGLHALKSLLEITPHVAVVAHPSDPEDGVRYGSVHDFAQQKGLLVIRGKATNTEIFDFVSNFAPNVIWCTDYRYLLPPNILQLTNGLAINLHPSLLPQYRGRAPINWALINGEPKIGLTAHLIDDGVDTGDILEQSELEVGAHDSIQDVLNNLYPIYESLSAEVLCQLIQGRAQPTKQTMKNSDTYPRRTPKDGLVDWTWSATKIHNFIRALTRPYPGAFSFQTFADKQEPQQVQLWKAETDISTEELAEGRPGRVVSCSQNEIMVQTGMGIIRILDWSTSNTDRPTIEAGSFFLEQARGQ